MHSVSEPYSYTICPWVTQFSNMMSYDHQTAEVSIPDVNPTALPQYGLFSMTAGDFLDVYRAPGIFLSDTVMLSVEAYMAFFLQVDVHH